MVTQNMRTIRSVPLRLRAGDGETIRNSHLQPLAAIRNDIEVRGEVFLPRESFEKINRELAGIAVPSTCARNATTARLRTCVWRIANFTGESTLIAVCENSSSRLPNFYRRWLSCASLGALRGGRGIAGIKTSTARDEPNSPSGAKIDAVG